MVCLKITVKGMVQGVGYRYFCHRKADEFNIIGYAKNLYNGDVELEIEAEKGLAEDFIKHLKIGPAYSRVTEIEVKEIPYTNKYRTFSVY